MSLKTHKNHQSTPIIRTSLNKESNVFKHNEIPNSIDRLCQHSEKARDTSKSLRDNYAAGDRLIVPDPFDNFSAERDGESRVKKKDAQIQTSSKTKRVRRKKTKKRPKLMNEEEDDWYFDVDCCNARNEKSGRLSVRVLQKKRAEYIDKFTAVNQQIEEITAALRETCCSENNLQNNDEFYCSSDRKATEEKREPENPANRIVARRSTKRAKRKTRDLTSVKKVTRSHVDCTNRKHRSTDLSTNSDDVVPRVDGAFTIQKTVRCSSGTSGNIQNCRLIRQISFDLDLTNDDDVRREFSLEDDYPDTICLGNNFAMSNGYAKDFVGSFAGESKYKRLVKEKAGETIILSDIKRRIDRDFDDLAEKSENDTTEEFFIVSPTKRDNFTRSFCKLIPSGDTASRKRTIDKIRSAPLLAASFDLDCSTDRPHIRDSRSHGCMSEQNESNKTSTLSKYLSCAQLSSLVSLDGNERANPTVINDSYSSSNSNRYDLDLNANVERSNLNSTSPDFLEHVARYDTARRCDSSCEFPIFEMINETNDENRRAFAKNPTREHFFLGERKEGDNSRVERHAADFTFETPKRNVGSIDSGVFSSSLIDLYLPESSSFSAGKSELKKKRRNDRKLVVGKSSSPIFDFSSDASCTDDTLDRRVDDVVRDLTKNLILCERRAGAKLREMRRVGTGKDARCVRIFAGNYVKKNL